MEKPAPNSQWLTFVFGQLPNIDFTDTAAIDELLPISPDLPDHVRIPVKKRSSQMAALPTERHEHR